MPPSFSRRSGVFPAVEGGVGGFSDGAKKSLTAVLIHEKNSLGEKFTEPARNLDSSNATLCKI